MTRRCPACGKKTDPLRAGHVAIFDERFHYFCDRGCREDWLQGGRPSRSSYRPTSYSSYRPPPLIPKAPPTITGLPVEAALPEPAPEIAPPPPPSVDSSPRPSSPALSSEPAPVVEPAFDGAPLLLVGLASGLLGTSLLLAGPSSVVEAIRIAIAFAGFVALAVRALALPRDPSDLHPAVLLAPGGLSIGVAVHAWLVADPAHGAAATFAGAVIAASAATTYLAERGRLRVRQDIEALSVALGAREAWVSRLRVGETILVETGATVPVDGVIIEGEATVLPWPEATEPSKKREGHAVVAGATVVEGSLRVLAQATGPDRSLARLILDPSRRADVFSKVPKLSRRVATLGAFAGAACLFLAGLSNGASGTELALLSIAGFSALSVASVGSTAGTHIARGIIAALRRGVVYRSAEDWDRASSASIAVFCARGTLLLDEPELTDLELVGPLDEARVLSLVSGVESARRDDPIALAIQRAAAIRKLRPDAVRSPTPQPGLGMTAVSSTGEALVVGSRALMLRERVSIAVAEATVAHLETHGRTVLLVSLGGKLVAALGLQDGLRPTARAAVQHLLDVQIEPVLLSGEARETCEALGRALDIEHLRPEILPSERTREIERLSAGGVTVAVIGRAGRDDGALAAAGISVALGGAGAANMNDWGAALVGDEVQDGALALTIAERARRRARVGLGLALAPSVLAGLLVAFGLIAPVYVPLSTIVGALSAVFHMRATEARAVSLTSQRLSA